jgi:pimeloyl-ACP methyl ester carboxylesterase
MKTGWNEIVLNDVRQWVSLRGDPSAPVLLFLHGGPGGAEFGPRRRYLRGLERGWRVVDWDQRGAGRSYRGDETAASLSLEILVADGLALVARLRDETGAPVVLAGHSFGTVLGTMMAARAPSLIAAYVGAAQVVDWAIQEALSYDWVLAEARRVDHAKAIQALERIGPPTKGVYASGTAGVETQRRWLGSLGGVSGDPGFLTRWMLSILLAGDYPISTKLRFSKGMACSMELIWPELGDQVRFTEQVRTLEVPVAIFAGDRDRITSLDQVRPWYDALRAPAKSLVVAPGTGHLNLFEAPAAFVQLLDRVRESLAPGGAPLGRPTRSPASGVPAGA